MGKKICEEIFPEIFLDVLVIKPNALVYKVSKRKEKKTTFPVVFPISASLSNKVR